MQKKKKTEWSDIFGYSRMNRYENTRSHCKLNHRSVNAKIKHIKYFCSFMKCSKTSRKSFEKKNH